MLLARSSGQEYASARAATEAEALAAYDKIRAAHLPDNERSADKPAPLTGRYAQLRDDLRAALQAGRAAEEADPEDGGSSNFDSASLYLPRWNKAKVEQAAKEAGTGCFTWKLFGQLRYVFRPDTHSQGNARSRNAEAMTAALCGMGYDACDYCQAD